MPSKVCNLCGERKKIMFFHRGSSRFGRSSRCMKCVAKANHAGVTPNPVPADCDWNVGAKTRREEER
jgi:hypothetical protein